MDLTADRASTGAVDPTTRRGPGHLLRDVALVLAAGAVASGAFLLVRHSLTDDAYLSLAYAKNLALRFHWGLTPGAVSNTATSPLNILLLAGLTALTRWGGGVHPVLALGALTVALAMVLAWAWTRLITALRLPWLTAPLGVALVLANPFLLAAIGLEVLLVPTVLILLVAMAAEGRPEWFGVVAGLALITRLDLILFVLPVALGVAAIRRKLGWAVVIALLVGLPWYVFSWFFFGSALPETLAIKQAQGGLFGFWSYLTGPVMYFISREIVVTLAFAPALLALVALLGWFVLRLSVRWEGRLAVSMAALSPLAALGVGGILYYAAYAALGVGPYHWYYVPPMVSLAAFLAGAVGAWWAAARGVARLRPVVPGLAFLLVGALVAGEVAVDVHQGVPWASPVIFGNWASAADYARVGAGLRAAVGDRTVGSPGEIGTLAYYCDCAIEDQFSDRGAAIQAIDRQLAGSSGLTRPLLDANYLWLDRRQQPKPLAYQLQYAAGPGAGPDVWQVYSAAKGVGHLTLVPVSPSGQ